MNITYRYLIAAATLVSTASLVDAQARGRMGPPPARANAATALTAEQRTQLRELREQQLVEQRALQEKHRDALAKIAPEQARRMSQLRDQRDRQDRQRRAQTVQQRGRGPQMVPPRGQPPRGQPPRGPQVRGQQMRPGVMIVPPQLGRGPAGPVIQGHPLPPRRGGDDIRPQDDRRQRGPVRRPPPPRDRR